MESAICLLGGLLVGGATYLLLQRHLLRQVFGLMLLGTGVNLLILTLGGVTRVTPPLVAEGANAAAGWICQSSRASPDSDCHSH